MIIYVKLRPALQRKMLKLNQDTPINQSSRKTSSPTYLLLLQTFLSDLLQWDWEKSSHHHQWFHHRVRWIVLKINFIFYTSLSSFFFLPPPYPMTILFVWPNIQPPNLLILCSGSLTSLKTPQSMSCLSTSSISTFKVQLFFPLNFPTERPIVHPYSWPIFLIHQPHPSILTSLNILVALLHNSFFACALFSICLCSSSTSPALYLSISLSLTHSLSH